MIEALELLKTVKKPLDGMWQEEHRSSSLVVLKAACCPLNVSQATFTQVCLCAGRLADLAGAWILLRSPSQGCCGSIVLSDVSFLAVLLKSSLGLQAGVLWVLWSFLLFVCLLFQFIYGGQ